MADPEQPPADKLHPDEEPRVRAHLLRFQPTLAKELKASGKLEEYVKNLVADTDAFRARLKAQGLNLIEREELANERLYPPHEKSLPKARRK